jgi:hypothetical protein
MADERKYYVLCRDNCKFEGMTKEQIIAAIAEATGNTPTNIDDAFITKLLDQNKNAAMRLWVGTEAEYNAVVASGGIDINTIYCIKRGDVFVFKNQIRGIDYWTEEDKREIIDEVSVIAIAAANAVQTDIDTHKENTSNPHGVTCGQIGAATTAAVIAAAQAAANAQSAADSKCQFASGWYNGTGTNTMSLSFPFVPKLVLIMGKFYVSSEYKDHFCYGFVDVASKAFALLDNATDGTASESHTYFSNVGTTVTIDGNTITFATDTVYAGLGGIQIFNLKDTRATQTSGAGYWWYAFG